jgi:hypothetical protein
MHIHSPNKPRKFKQKSVRSTFWDRKGVLSAIENKTCGMLTSVVVLLLYRVGHTQELLVPL